MSHPPIIWFFKEETSGDRFARAFGAAGFDTRQIPVLRTEFVQLPDTVPSVDAVVVTSARAVEAIKGWEHVGDLKKLPWFAIGPATRFALGEFGIAAEHEAPGSADFLAKIILDADVQRVLFLAGDPHRDELPAKLRQSGVTIEIQVVYRTHPRSLGLLEDAETPDWAVFFSPRGVSIVAEQTTDNWHLVAKAALGPTTAQAMHSIDWEPDAVAVSPTPEALLTAILMAHADIL